MVKRVTTAAVFLLIVYAGFAYESLEWLIIGAASVFAVLCTFELMVLMRRKGLRVYRRVAAIGVLALILEALLTRLDYSIHVFGIAVCVAWILRMRGRVKGAWDDVSATCFTMAYIGIPFAAMMVLFTSGAAGKAWLLLMLGIIWTTDSAALFVGRMIGRNKLWPKISPGKTWEGSIGGVAGALILVFLARVFFPGHFAQAGNLELVFFAVLFSCIGQLGDLAESLLKRDVGAKDSGSELTGHGGFLDLMDAVLFSAMPLLIYIELLHPGIINPPL